MDCALRGHHAALDGQVRHTRNNVFNRVFNGDDLAGTLARKPREHGAERGRFARTRHTRHEHAPHRRCQGLEEQINLVWGVTQALQCQRLVAGVAVGLENADHHLITAHRRVTLVTQRHLPVPHVHGDHGRLHAVDVEGHFRSRALLGQQGVTSRNGLRANVCGVLLDLPQDAVPTDAHIRHMPSRFDVDIGGLQIQTGLDQLAEPMNLLGLPDHPVKDRLVAFGLLAPLVCCGAAVETLQQSGHDVVVTGVETCEGVACLLALLDQVKPGGGALLTLKADDTEMTTLHHPSQHALLLVVEQLQDRIGAMRENHLQMGHFRKTPNVAVAVLSRGHTGCC